MSCQLEPAIWSRDTGLRIPCFDRCQLIITWMSNTKEVHSKPRLHISLSTCYLEYGSHLARLHRRRRRAYAPTSNTASHDNHEKINSWVSFCFHIWVAYGAPLQSFERVTKEQKTHPALETCTFTIRYKHFEQSLCL